MSKVILVLGLILVGTTVSGCETARGLSALGYCLIHDSNPNKRCT